MVRIGDMMVASNGIPLEGQCQEGNERKERGKRKRTDVEGKEREGNGEEKNVGGKKCEQTDRHLLMTGDHRSGSAFHR